MKRMNFNVLGHLHVLDCKGDWSDESFIQICQNSVADVRVSLPSACFGKIGGVLLKWPAGVHVTCVHEQSVMMSTIPSHL